MRDELHFQIERSSQVKSTCRDGFQLAVSTHVSTAAGNASVLQGIIQVRDEDVTNASVQRTQGAVGIKRTEEGLQAIGRMNVAWGKAILEHSAVSLAQIAQL